MAPRPLPSVPEVPPEASPPLSAAMPTETVRMIDVILAARASRLDRLAEAARNATEETLASHLEGLAQRAQWRHRVNVGSASHQGAAGPD